MPFLGAAGVMFLAGIGIPLLAALNAALGQRLGAPAAAATVLFAVALICSVVAMILTRGSLRALPTAPVHLYGAGVLIAFYVLSITWIAPSFGIGNAVFFVLIGQLVSAAIIDHFGLFGARVLPMSPARAMGLALMCGGLVLTQLAGRWGA